MKLRDKKEILALIKRAYHEDIPAGDITTDTILGNKNRQISGKVISKGDYIVSGIEIAKLVYSFLDRRIMFRSFFNDGEQIARGRTLYEVKGRINSLLKAERVSLNIVSHMMGISSKTRKIVDKISGTNALVLDTRKTLPGLRLIQKMAVMHGGGCNHRFSLSDAVLIKENHIEAAGGITKALNVFSKIRKKYKIEIEVKNIDEFKEAIAFMPDIIMLDNMNVVDIKEAVIINNGRTKLEVSGGIDEGNILEYANVGVDYISVGALTHTIAAADLSFLFEGLI